MTPRNFVFALVTGASILFTGLAAPAQQVLPGHVPAVIAEKQLPPLGRLPGTNRLELVLQLPLRHRAELTNFLAQLYDPASTNYHHYLSKEQFTAKFGPTTNDYQAVIHFAKSHGLEVRTAHRSRLVLDVAGKVSDIETAFHVTLQSYQHPTEARTFYAPDVDPSVDASVPIFEIGGLSDYPEAQKMAHTLEATGKPGTASGSGYDQFYVSKDLRNAYVPGSSLAGSGQFVGLFETYGYYTNDIKLYEKFCGLTNVPLQNILIDGATGIPSTSDDLEVELDIEMAVAMAPALAGVVVFQCPGGYAQGLDVLDSMTDNTQINQFSSSIGYTSANPYSYFDQALMTLATQGQSYFMASGDGDAWTEPIWVPAASPYATAVGGTTLTMTSGGGAYTSEMVWNSGSTLGTWSQNNSADEGSGGGISSYYAIPSWQTGINMSTNHGSSTMRNIPDVAMVAYGCYVVVNNGTTNSGVYGTSVAAPLWAAYTALINQQAAAGNKLPVGFINSVVYPLLSLASYTNDFHDITTGNNYSANSPSEYPATPGFDLCTGLGTPRGTNFINAVVARLTSEPVPTITGEPTNETVAVGGSAVFSLTATGTAPIDYFWRLNGTSLVGQTNASFTTNNVQLVNSGQLFTCVVSNSAGSVTSSVATLTVQLPPGISGSSPTNQTVAQGGSASFTVSASGSSLNYYWLCNGVFMPGATNATYTTNDVQLADSGAQFSCLVSNGVGSVTSAIATLTVDVPPSITGQPASQTIPLGETAMFTVTAAGTPLNYFWLRNGTFMTGQTNAAFTTNNVQLAGSGQNFSCVITNPVGSVTSRVATLTVTLSAAQAPGFQVSLAGTNLLIMGTNGIANATYTLLTSTNLLLPVTAWTRVSTNVLGTGGSFTLTATNAVNPHSPQQFYLLKVQ